MLNDTAETERTRQLAELALLDTPVDPVIEHVCDLARAFFDVSIAFVSVVDQTHAHVVAHNGLAICSVARKDSICGLTVAQGALLVIPDTNLDERVRTSPLVTAAPHFRFYAGIPLALEPGLPIATLCIADTRARHIALHKLETLRTLAAIVVEQFAHRVGRRALARQALELVRRQLILAQTERFAQVGGFEVDPTDGTLTGSTEFHRLYDFDEAPKPTLDTFFRASARADQNELRHQFLRLAVQQDPVDFETIVETRDGTHRHIRIHAQLRPNSDGVRKIAGTVQDISDRKIATAELEWIATHDSLTRICNRQTFNQRIEDAVRASSRLDRGIALITVDIDHFKAINDSLGHDAGDAALVCVATRLRAIIGNRGLVARLGGDEFGILMSPVPAKDAVTILAMDVLSALRAPFVYGAAELGIRATLGVAIHDPLGSSDAPALFKNADIALYHAKQAGRDGVTFYDPSMRDALATNLQKTADARAAILEGRIEPYYQPMICLESGRIKGFEALLRWSHPRNGLSAPDDMGDAFADTELAIAIGRGMHQKIMADMVAWRDAGLDFGPITVNVAESEFYAGVYADQLVASLDANGFDRNAIVVEITEAAFLSHRLELVEAALDALTAEGITIALDHFGTGFTSLTHLKRYPVGSIKIDRSLVMKIETDPEAATVVDAITALAHSLKIAIAAVGIETQAQLDFLQARKCAIGEGYYFAKPMAGSRVPYFLRNWSMARKPDAQHAITG